MFFLVPAPSFAASLLFSFLLFGHLTLDRQRCVLTKPLAQFSGKLSRSIRFRGGLTRRKYLSDADRARQELCDQNGAATRAPPKRVGRASCPLDKTYHGSRVIGKLAAPGNNDVSTLLADLAAPAKRTESPGMLDQAIPRPTTSDLVSKPEST